MRKFCTIVLSCMTYLACVQSSANSTVLQATAMSALPAANHGQMVPPAPALEVGAYVLMDATSGEIIAEKNAHKKSPPASLTKIMSLYVISNALKTGQIRLDDKVRVSKKAWAMDGSKMFIKEGQLITVQDLIHGIIVASGNDACIAMSEYIAGSEDGFVSIMNQMAQSLGMKETHFTDCTGMPDPEHYSTPHDLAILSRALITHFPEYYPWYSQKWFTFNDIKQPNRNRLLWRYEYADGIKTGHTRDAGYCLIASAKKDNMRLISVVMNAPTDYVRNDGSQRLLNYGFRFYKTYHIYRQDETIAKPRVWKGRYDSVPVGIKDDIVLTIPSGKYKQLKIVTSLQKPLTAPIHKGQSIGELKIMLGSDTLSQQPMIALQEIPKGGLWTRMTDSVSMSVHKYLDDDDDDGEQDQTG